MYRYRELRGPALAVVLCIGLFPGCAEEEPQLPVCPSCQESSCEGCPAQGYCLEGVCYDCSEEGFCRATTCPDDGNPCTQEMVGPDGKCTVFPNYVCVEILEDLQEMHRGAQAYYLNWEKDPDANVWHPPESEGGYFPLVAPATPEVGSCCYNQAGADLNHDNLCDNAEAGLYQGYFNTATWRFLNFRKPGPHRFLYRFEERPERGAEGFDDDVEVDEVLFEAVVVTDLDCDGFPGEFKVTGHFDPESEDWDTMLPEPYGQYNKLALPLEVVYVPEKEGAEPMTIPSMWPIEAPSEELLASAYAIGLEGTYPWRFKEATVNLLKMDDGAQVYFNSPQAKSNLPPEFVADGDEELLEEWGKYLPKYYPLAQGLTPVSGSCCTGKGADNNYDNRCDTNPEVWTEATWAAIGFALEGQHQWLYAFEQESDDYPSHPYVGRAHRDPYCTGMTESWELLGNLDKLSWGGGWSQPIVEFVYRPTWGNAAAVNVLLYWDMYSNFMNEVGGWSPSSDTPLPPHEQADLEAFLYGGQIEAGISEYWEAHCELPEPPEQLTPSCWGGCDNDADGDGYQDGNSEEWQHEFWAAIGFSITIPHEYRFRVHLTKLEPEFLLAEVEAAGNHDYGQGAPLGFSFYGILGDEGGACTATWFNGYNVAPAAW